MNGKEAFLAYHMNVKSGKSSCSYFVLESKWNLGHYLVSIFFIYIVKLIGKIDITSMLLINKLSKQTHYNATHLAK